MANGQTKQPPPSPTPEEAAAQAAAAKLIEEAKAQEEAGYVDLPDAPEPMTMLIIATNPEEQGPCVLINSADFDSTIHEPYDEAAKRLIARRRARLRKQLNPDA